MSLPGQDLAISGRSCYDYSRHEQMECDGRNATGWWRRRDELRDL